MDTLTLSPPCLIRAFSFKKLLPIDDFYKIAAIGRFYHRWLNPTSSAHQG